VLSQHFVDLPPSIKANVITGNVRHLQDLILGQTSSESLGKLIFKNVPSKVKVDDGDVILKDLHELGGLLITQVIVGEA
jgi:hypothetical protein